MSLISTYRKAFNAQWTSFMKDFEETAFLSCRLKLIANRGNLLLKSLNRNIITEIELKNSAIFGYRELLDWWSRHLKRSWWNGNKKNLNSFQINRKCFSIEENMILQQHSNLLSFFVTTNFYRLASESLRFFSC